MALLTKVYLGCLDMYYTATAMPELLHSKKFTGRCCFNNIASKVCCKARPVMPRLLQNNKDGKINKEDVALITWARSQANSEKERK